MAKAKKKRAETYDPKLAIKGSFGDVIKVSVGKQPENKPKQNQGKKNEKK